MRKEGTEMWGKKRRRKKFTVGLQQMEVDFSTVDEACEKVERLHEVLKEASALSKELASMEITASVKTDW